MPLQIIGAGYGRTGTMSTYTALNALGLRCYHMMEVIRNKDNADHLDFWWKVANTPPGTRHDWEAVFGGYKAAVDNPACCVWRELMAAYPDAKVLLTLHPRGPDAWFDSTIDTIYFTENRWQFKVLEALTPFGRKFGGMSRKLIWQRNLRNTLPDRQKSVAEYERHIAEVREAVPADRLLVFSVDQGWGPLCKFLGVPAPDTPFPNVNDRADVQKALRGITRGAYFIIAAGVVLVAAVIAGLWWWAG